MKTLLTPRPRNLVQLNQSRKSSYFTGMEKPTFLPQEATPEQRAAIVRRMVAAGEHQGAIRTDSAMQVFDRYVAGELTLEQAGDLAMSVYQRQAVSA